MKKIAISLLLLTFCSEAQGANSAGHGYMDSQRAVMASQSIASRDLTDEEMEEAEDLPGGGYSDGKWTGENPEKCGSS